MDETRRQDALALGLASVLTLALLSWFQLTAGAVVGVDAWYHLGVAREIARGGPLDAFPWTPLALFGDSFADKEFLFHVLLVPLSGLDALSGAQLGALLGQAALVATLAGILWVWRVRAAPLLVLGLAALGPTLILRIAMCRPHTWTIAFSLLALALLVAKKPRPVALFAVAALHGLVHSGGWLVIAYAGLWSCTGLFARADRRTLDWKPVALAGGGWLLGQLVHPNFPRNFEVLWLQNVVVPMSSGGAGEAAAALNAALGAELHPSSAAVFAANGFTTALVVALLAAVATRRELRTRAALTTALSALVFVLLAVFLMRRMWELAGPLALLGAGALLREHPDLVPPARRTWALTAACALLAAGALNASLRALPFFPDENPPDAMARFLGEHGAPGARVFTAQWGDSAPLFWYAPQLETLVALDPTFLYAADPDLYLAYARVVQGLDEDPVATMKGRFGARYLTLWRIPAFERFGRAVLADPRARTVYQDAHYSVLDLGP